MRRLQRWFIGWLCLGLAACLPAAAQTKLDNAQLDQLMAPVALYPDSLLSQILMGATYPEDVAAAAKWSAAHTSESGDQAVKAVEGEAWDPSVKSLVAFPSVMDMMGRQPDWVKSVGDAFLAQPDAVMDSVQRLRVQAQKAGNLKSTPQQKVTSNTTNDKTVVVIEPADLQVVYVPSYNPTVVYGAWAYPSYPPYYYPPPPGSVFATSLVAGIGFGLGVAAVNSMWGGFDWGHGDVDIDVNRYNNINVNQRIDRNNVNNNKVGWRAQSGQPRQHAVCRSGQPPAFRQPAPGRRAESRAAAPGPGRARAGRGAEFPRCRSQPRGAIVRRTHRPGDSGHGQQGAGRGQGAAGRGEAAGGRGQGGAGRGEAAGGRGQGQGPQAGQGARERPQGGAGAAQHDRAGMSTQDRQAAAQRQRADESAARDRGRASNSTNALSDAGNGERMRQQSHRGEMSRGGGGGVQRGGGGHGGGRGGGGGGHFGGRR